MSSHELGWFSWRPMPHLALSSFLSLRERIEVRAQDCHHDNVDLRSSLVPTVIFPGQRLDNIVQDSIEILADVLVMKAENTNALLIKFNLSI
jgi:hypothetical protein